MKKVLTILVTLLMLVGMVGCSKEEEITNTYNIKTGPKPENNIWNTNGTIFPLAEPTTFTVLTEGYRVADLDALMQSSDWKQLEEATNVHIEFVSIGDYDSEVSRDNLQLRLMSGEYGDAIWSFALNTLTSVDIDELGDSGMIVALDKYMEDSTIMPNFNATIYPYDNIYNNMKYSDGHVYAIAGVSEINYYTIGEGLMQVNSEWLRSWQTANGIDHTPQTLEEFENMLMYFRDSDLNGNGKADEIPYMIAQAGYAGCMTLEHAMGMYGIATKDSALDMDIMIDDNGTVSYAYTQDNYKAALEKFAEWYKEGYIWKDIFTGNAETVTNIVADAKNNFGLYNACEDIAGFEPILPPTIEGYTAKYHIHPNARKVVRQANAVITDKCEHPEILAAYFDLLFNFENNILARNGSVVVNSDYFKRNDDGTTEIIGENYPLITNVEDTPIGYALGLFEADTLKNWEDAKYDVASYWSGTPMRVKGGKMYEEAGIWNPTQNLWPRLTIVDEQDATDYAFAYTDVSTTVAEYRAKFITGQFDVETHWDEFQAKIKDLGVEKMRDIIQKTYDEYIGK